MTASYTRALVLAFRTRAQQLDREEGDLAGTAVLDIGVQDTGPDGARWALAVRGVNVSALRDDALALAWTLRVPVSLPDAAGAETTRCLSRQPAGVLRGSA